jgi:hypothetical protein
VAPQTSSGGASFLLPKPTDLAAQGLTMQSTDGKALTAVIAFGTNIQGAVRVQRTGSVKTATLRATVPQSDLVLSSADVLSPTTLNEQLLTPSGVQVKPARPLEVAHEAIAPH